MPSCSRCGSCVAASPAERLGAGTAQPIKPPDQRSEQGADLRGRAAPGGLEEARGPCTPVVRVEPELVADPRAVQAPELLRHEAEVVGDKRERLRAPGCTVFFFPILCRGFPLRTQRLPHL